MSKPQLQPTALPTYAEVAGKPFDWPYAVDHPDEFDHSQLVELAHNWVTCACGNQCALIPRGEGGDTTGKGVPLDDLLVRLGIRFAIMVRNKNWEAAREFLEAIEVRSTELIGEILGQ